MLDSVVRARLTVGARFVGGTLPPVAPACYGRYRCGHHHYRRCPHCYHRHHGHRRYCSAPHARYRHHTQDGPTEQETRTALVALLARPPQLPTLLAAQSASLVSALSVCCWRGGGRAGGDGEEGVGTMTGGGGGVERKRKRTPWVPGGEPQVRRVGCGAGAYMFPDRR